MESIGYGANCSRYMISVRLLSYRIGMVRIDTLWYALVRFGIALRPTK